MFFRWKHQTVKLHFIGWLTGFGQILDGLTAVVSFGFYCSDFERTLLGYRSEVYIKFLKENKKD